MGSPFRRTRIATVCTWAIAAASAAQPTEPPIPEPAPPRQAPPSVTWELSVPSTVVFNTEFDDEPGDLSIYRTGANLRSVWPSGDRARLEIGLEYEFSAYEFNDASGFIEGTDEPWSDVHRASLSALYAAQRTERWGWFVGTAGTFSGEDGAEFGESLTGAAYGGLRYAFSPDLTLGFGAAVRTRLEESPLVLPLVQLDWRFAEHWSLSVPGRPAVTLAFRPNERWTFTAGAGWEFRDFRLDESGELPGGVVSEQRFPISLGVLLRATDRIRIGLGAGVYLGQSFEVSDEDGDEVADIDADPTPFLSLELAYRF